MLELSGKYTYSCHRDIKFKMALNEYIKSYRKENKIQLKTSKILLSNKNKNINKDYNIY